MFHRILRTIGLRLQPFLLRPASRYRLLLPSIKMAMPDYDETLLEKALRFIEHAHIAGNYLEFGVWKGRSFTKAYHLWHSLFARKGKLSEMEFFAFDSFQGLPEITSPQDNTGEFKKGDYFFSQESFERALQNSGVDKRRVHIIPGWFSDTLTGKQGESIHTKKAAIAWIDCDLYESTVPVLAFLTTRIQDGTVLIFDDWFAFRGHPDRGQQRAFSEWLRIHPQWHATEWQVSNWRAKAFIMNQVS